MQTQVVASGDRHIDRQVQAVRRIYDLLYPNHYIRYIFKSINGANGAPDQTTITYNPGNGELAATSIRQIHAHLDFSYLGSLDTEGYGDRAPDIEVIALIPHATDPNNLHDTKRAPTFENRYARFMVWYTPLLFEQAKYHYQQQQISDRAAKYMHTALPKATKTPFGLRPGVINDSKRPAILIGFCWLELGGAEKLAFDCVQWALDAGWRVLVVADKPVGQRLAQNLPNSEDVEFIRLDAYLPAHLMYEMLVSLIWHENIRAIHIHHHVRLYENLAAIKNLFPDIQVIDSTHIIEHADGGFPRISGVWSAYIDYHHVISRELVTYYLDIFSLSEKVKLGRMLAPPKKGKEKKAPAFRLKTGQKSLRLIFVGRLVHQKRAVLAVVTAARILRWARGAGVAVNLDIVGTGRYLDTLRRTISRRKLDNIVTFHPPDADVPALLGKADVLLVPSSNEGLALVCYEAIQQGVIPISTRVGGQDELLPDELLVPLSPWACVRQSTKILRDLLTKPEFLAQCQDGVAEKFREIGKDPTAQETLTDLYRDILNGVATT